MQQLAGPSIDAHTRRPPQRGREKEGGFIADDCNDCGWECNITPYVQAQVETASERPPAGAGEELQGQVGVRLRGARRLYVYENVRSPHPPTTDRQGAERPDVLRRASGTPTRTRTASSPRRPAQPRSVQR